MTEMRYAAPELATDNDYTEKVDVYSFGIIVYEVITGVFSCTRNGAAHVDLSKPLPECWRTLVKECISHNPSSRPSFAELCLRIRNTLA